VRVIAGAYKGRRLKAPSWGGLRPTSDKLRETLFNILAPRIAGARVLDGFAGTGAVGIEALSRGAAHVTFIESDRRASALIESNLAECRIQSGYTIERGDVTTVLDRAPHDVPYDVMVLDPPYDMGSVHDVLAAAASHLAYDGVLVLERATRNSPDVPASLTIAREVRSGDSTLTFLSTVERGH
jgi:16S rRNA (guanine966-N2)-methyltransferase